MARLLLVTAALFVIAAPQRALAQCPPAERAALEALDRAWGEASARGDRAHLEALYAPEYASITLTGTTDRATDIQNTVRNAEAARANPAGAPRTTYDNYIISCTPNTATITHRGSTTTIVNGVERTTHGRAIHFLERRGGRWQVVSTTGHALSDAALLTDMENAWNTALRTRDVTWFERNLADDFTSVTSSTGVLESKPAAIASIRNSRTAIDAVDLSEVNVRLYGDVAVVTGVNRIRGRDERGQPMDRRVRFTDTFVKRDGRWVAVASQGTRIE